MRDLGSSGRPLLDLVPGLAERWPRLFEPPTPVRRLTALGAAVGHHDLWLKDDRPAGGSKSRKLEPLLGEAVARGARSVVSFGAIGGSHVLAVARHAAELGLTPVLYVSSQPLPAGSFARQSFEALRRTGARCVRLPMPVRLAVESAMLLVARRRGNRLGRSFVIPSGGSNDLGCLGMVNAALELGAQLPELPAEVFVACGSCGTAAGLSAGFALHGRSVAVRAVDVSSAPYPSRRRLRRLVAQTSARLSALGCETGGSAPTDLRLVAGYGGEAYGVPTPASAEAQAMAAELERLALEEAYTAKAMAAFLDRARETRGSGKALLFWNTCGREPA